MKRSKQSLKVDDSRKLKITRLSKALLLNNMMHKAGHGFSREDEDDDKKLSSRKVSHGSHLVSGQMDHGMEDYLAAETRKVNGHQLGLYAIFDGHSGQQVAEYLQAHLFDKILSQPDFWADPKEATKRAYKATDDEILEKVAGSRGGSTAVTAILINGEMLIVANVGDSRAVLCRDGVANQLTVDHDPQKEKDLVESRGGCVVKLPGNVPRVDAQLAMSRAFGDGDLKEHITSEPDISIEKIDTEVDFIILASDGLWKVMSNQGAFDCIRGIDDAQEAAEKLTQKALSRKSYDDISCIVLVFD
ncbi:probable protein phosphatase 2C 28 [Rosa rugosa]|uniref:probable protein phosphatase 2C 28 n=1 Tax=Rosa rugosa TaxID=74645 RepID=UPI002B409F43|nr:probable protein phosphatase 2C 28 [Rosa rugosa]